MIAAADSVDAGLLARLPPQNLDAERALLGSLLVADGAVDAVARIVRPQDFYRTAHRLVFDACLALRDRAEPVDAVLVASECERRGTFEDVGGRDALASLATGVSSGSNVEHYARIVREKAKARAVIHAAAEIQRRGYDGEDGEALIDGMRSATLQLEDEEDAAAPSTASIIDQAFAEIEAPEAARRIPTFYTALDGILGGFEPGELVLLAARPSMGKSALALNLALRIAGNAIPTALISLEMSPVSIVRRALANKSGIPLRQVCRKPGALLGGADRTRLAEAGADLKLLPLLIQGAAGCNTATLRSRIRRLVDRHNVALVVVDYLGLVRVPDSVRAVRSRNDEVSYISSALKSIAVEFGIVVVALAQLNREVERENRNAEAGKVRTPGLSDLRDSGALEQDADVVAFLHRDAYYTKDPNDHVAQVIVAKQRNGETGTVRLAWIPEVQSFTDLQIGGASA